MAGKWQSIHSQLMAGEVVAITAVTEVTIRTTLSKLLSAEKRAAKRSGLPCPYHAVTVNKEEDYFRVSYSEVNYNYTVLTEPQHV